MKKQTLAIDTPYQHPDAYGALSMPVYHCAAYEFGVKPKLCDLTDIEAVEKAIDDTTCCIFMEIITNPQMEIAGMLGCRHIASSCPFLPRARHHRHL